MVNEFKAELKDGQIIVKPIIQKEGKNIKVIVPSFPLIHKLKRELEKENGKRDIQQIQSELNE